MLEFFAVLFLFSAVMAWIAGMIILNGWVLTVLWGWFAVPFGVPPLTIAWAVGIIIILSHFLLGRKVDLEKEKKEKGDWGSLAKAFGTSLLRSAVVLGSGWIAHQFM